MVLIIKLDFLNVNMFFKIFFLKTFFSYIPGRNFSRFTTRVVPAYIPREIFVFTTRNPTLIIRIFTFFRTIHTNEFLYICKTRAKKSEFPECGNLYNYFQTLGTQFAYSYQFA